MFIISYFLILSRLVRLLRQIYSQSGILIAITTQEGVIRIDPNYVEQEQEDTKKAKL